MKKGFVVGPEVMARTEQQDAMARLDFHSAMRRLEEFQRVWPEAKLTWEPELVRAGARMAAKLLDLDSGYGAWQKMEARLNTLDVSRKVSEVPSALWLRWIKSGFLFFWSDCKQLAKMGIQ